MCAVKYFDDGSSLEWIDRETLKYVKGEYAVQVWVDFEEGFFSSGRVIKSSSIRKWDAVPAGCSDEIDESNRKEIIEKIRAYYKRKKCRVED